MDFGRFERECDYNTSDLVRKTSEISITSKKFQMQQPDQILRIQVEYKKQLQEANEALLNLKKCLSEEQYKSNAANEDNIQFGNEVRKLDENVFHMQSKKEKIQLACEDLKSKSTISSYDSNILNLWKRKFTLFKEISGIKWDFMSPETQMVGYVRNKKAGTTRHFNLTDMTIDRVWDLLEEASHADWQSISKTEDKENCSKGNSNK